MRERSSGVRELQLRVGDVHELTLRGLGSAGYSWQTEVTGPEGVLEVRRGPSGPSPSAPAGGPPPTSGSLPVVLRLAAVGEGRVKLHLSLRRVWEQDVPAIEEDELTVTVTG